MYWNNDPKIRYEVSKENAISKVDVWLRQPNGVVITVRMRTTISRWWPHQGVGISLCPICFQPFFSIRVSVFSFHKSCSEVDRPKSGPLGFRANQLSSMKGILGKTLIASLRGKPWKGEGIGLSMRGKSLTLTTKFSVIKKLFVFTLESVSFSWHYFRFRFENCASAWNEWNTITEPLESCLYLVSWKYSTINNPVWKAWLYKVNNGRSLVDPPFISFSPPWLFYLLIS